MTSCQLILLFHVFSILHSYVYDISFGRFVNSYVVEHRAIPCPRSGHGCRFNECGRYRGSLN
jgi:hypothetical protein